MVNEIGASLVTVAKDVKLQVEFNPAVVGSYRLIGYENRLLADEEFNDDTVDAGEMGAGHSISALYEIIPRHSDHNPTKIDPLKYQEAPTLSTQASQGEMLTLKIRYKEPDKKKSRLLAFPLVDQMKGLNATSDDFRFASAVAAFGMILRESSDVGKFNLDDVIELATPAIGYDPYGYRAGLIDLVEQAGKFTDIR